MQKVSRFIIEKIPRTRTNTQILSYIMHISIDSTNLAEFVFLLFGRPTVNFGSFSRGQPH